MKILIIGNGGREHALAWKVSQSPQVEEVFVAKGNAGIASIATQVEIEPTDIPSLVAFAQERAIDLTIVGPEEPLCLGVVDAFEAAGLVIFGPNRHCAQFEGSKDFTKQFLVRHQIPTATYETVTSYEEGIRVTESLSLPIVLKADGLALGKGVVIAQTREEVKETLDSMMNHHQFGAAGHQVVIEEYLTGEEISLLCLVSHNKLFPLDMAHDYKKAEEGDQGLNTGGLGGYSPANSLATDLHQGIQTLLAQIEYGLESEGFDFTGVLFVGLMVDHHQPKVLEFNVRFGDPETQVLLPRLESDLVELIQKAIANNLNEHDLQWSPQHSVGVVLHSKGYPQTFDKNHPIELPPSIASDQLLFHNGTEKIEDTIVNIGGRVLTAVGLGSSRAMARERAYELVKQIKSSNLSYRQDIGQ